MSESDRECDGPSTLCNRSRFRFNVTVDQVPLCLVRRAANTHTHTHAHTHAVTHHHTPSRRLELSRAHTRSPASQNVKPLALRRSGRPTASSCRTCSARSKTTRARSSRPCRCARGGSSGGVRGCLFARRHLSLCVGGFCLCACMCACACACMRVCMSFSLCMCACGFARHARLSALQDSWWISERDEAISRSMQVHMHGYRRATLGYSRGTEGLLRGYSSGAASVH